MFESTKIYVGEKIDVRELVRTFDRYRYTRCRKVSGEGDFSLTGETLVVYPATFEYPVRIEIFDDLVESIKSVDLATFKTISSHRVIIVLPLRVIRKTRLKKSRLK